jgi:hypothetical protein
MKKTELRKFIRQVISEDLGPGLGARTMDSDAYYAKLDEVESAISKMLSVAQKFESISELNNDPNLPVTPNELGLLVPEYNIKDLLKDQPRMNIARAFFEMPAGITLSQFLEVILKQIKSQKTYYR